MATRAARDSSKSTRLALRFVIRQTDEGFTAECIDAGAAGIGASRKEAINELMDSLDALFADSGPAMKVPALPAEERLFRRLEKLHAPDESNANVVAWGRVEQLAADIPGAVAFDVHTLSVAA